MDERKQVTEDSQASSQSDKAGDPLVGKWINKNVNIGNAEFLSLSAEFQKDGTGTCKVWKNSSVYQKETIIWRKLWENKYIFEIGSEKGGVNYAMVEYDPVQGTLMDKNGRVWNDDTKQFLYPGKVRIWYKEE